MPASTPISDLIEARRTGIAFDPTPEGQPNLRPIRASDIEAALLDETSSIHRNGLTIKNARITGALSMMRCSILFPISFIDCNFEQNVSFAESKLHSLDLSGSQLNGLNIASARIEHSFSANSAAFLGLFRAEQIQVGGNFNMQSAHVLPSHPVALDLDGAEIRGSAYVSETHCMGQFRLMGTKISGSLYLNNTLIVSRDRIAILADNLTISIDFIMKKTQIKGRLSARHLTVGGDLYSPGLEVAAGDGLLAIDFTSSSFHSHVDLTGLTCSGWMSLQNISTRGSVRLRKSAVRSSVGLSLDFSNSHIIGNVELHHSDLVGTVRFANSTLVGSFRGITTTIRGEQGVAISAQNSSIEGDFHFRELTSEGMLAFQACNISGQFLLQDSTISAPYEDSINMLYSSVGASFYLDKCAFLGTLMLSRLTTGTDLTIVSSPVQLCEAKAIDLDDVVVGGNLIITQTDLSNSLIAKSSKVTGAFQLFELNIRAPHVGVDLTHAVVESLSLGEVNFADAGLVLDGASIGILALPYQTHLMPQLQSAQAISVQSLGGGVGQSREAIRHWLDLVRLRRGSKSTRSRFVAQPWHALADAMQSLGYSGDARWLRVMAANRITSDATLPTKLVRWVYRVLAGYGYRPWLVLVWMAAIWGAAFTLVSLNQEAFSPTDNAVSRRISELTGAGMSLPNAQHEAAFEASYPQLQPFLYATQVAIPASLTGQSQPWRVTEDQGIGSALLGLRGFAWALSAMLLASITGLLRKI